METARKKHLGYLLVGNFIILSLFGVVLRYMQLFSLPGFNYQFLLHAHSHFAFAGWMFLAIMVLVTDSISREVTRGKYRLVLILGLISAFGMLFSFSVQGYKAISIVFSTLFILAGYRFSYLVLKDPTARDRLGAISYPLIRWALLLACLSSLGPFALGPLMAGGFKNTPLYQNAIYFYLHFQMNGFMLLSCLGLIGRDYLREVQALKRPVHKALNTFILSGIPLFLIFSLWSKPAPWIWFLAFIAASLNMVSWFSLCRQFKSYWTRFPLLIRMAIVALSMKVIIQTVICLPVIGEWGFSNRNLIIGYIHLLTLGCLSPVLLNSLILRGFLSSKPGLVPLNYAYLISVALYLCLLFLQPLLGLFHWVIPDYYQLLCILSVVFFVIGFFYLDPLKYLLPTPLHRLRKS